MLYEFAPSQEKAPSKLGKPWRRGGGIAFETLGFESKRPPPNRKRYTLNPESYTLNSKP